MVCELRAPIFDGTHYRIWEARMITIFKSEDLWEIVQNGIEDYNDMEAHGNKKAMDPNSKDVRMKDAKALGIIQGAVTTDILFKIIHEQTANGAWNFLSREAMKESSAILNGSPKNDSFPRILRVGDIFVGLKEEDFKRTFWPRVISIGPYHHYSPTLQPLERLKRIITNEIFEVNRVKEARSEIEKSIQKRIRIFKDCHADMSVIEEYDDEQFTQMMLVDGCFVITFLGYCLFEEEEEEGCGFEWCYQKFEDAGQAHKFGYVLRDLILLENQIPYEVLQIILKYIRPDTTVEKFAHGFLSTAIMANDSILQPKDKNRPHHLLHLLWMVHTTSDNNSADQVASPPSLWARAADELLKIGNKTRGKLSSAGLRVKIPSSAHRQPPDVSVSMCGSDSAVQKRNKTQNANRVYSLRNVTELTAAGIHLKPMDTFSFHKIRLGSYWMIFSKLNLPKIIIEDATETFFRNLMACEIYLHVDSDKVFASFVCFLDELIDGPEDVKQLRKAGVLENDLGSDKEVADLFNNLTTNVSYEPRVFEDVKNQIKGHYDTRWKVWIAEAYHNYFSSPWTFISFVAAAYLLIVATYTSFIQKSDCDSLCGHLKKTL